MKKLIPLLIFIMAFTGFLSTQILWDSFHLNAELEESDKQKHSVYERAFQDLKFTTTKKTSVELKQLKTPIVMLNFWASWCIPCLQEFPSLVRFQEAYKGKVTVIGVNGDQEDHLQLIRKTEEKYRLNFESVADPDSSISNRFLINTYPVTIVFHRGKVLYLSRKIHDFMSAEFQKVVNDALKVK